MRFNQQVAEAERKQAESLKSASQGAAAFAAECAKLGFHHRSPIRNSLAGLGSEIPSLLEDVLRSIQSDGLARAASYYSGFVSFAHHCPSSEVLPTLHEIIEGQTSLPPNLTQPDGAKDATPVLDIDWGVEAGNVLPVLDIDWTSSAQTPEVEGTSAEISWEFEVVASANDQVDHESVDTKANGGEEDGLVDNWDIAMEEAEDDPSSIERHEEKDIPSENSQICDPLLSAAVRRLEIDADYRSRLLDDLLELKSFLLQRKSEVQKGCSDIQIHLILLSSSCSTLVKSVDSTSALDQLLSSTEAALSSLSNQRLKQLLMIKSSKRYFERLATGLERRAIQEARMLAAAKEAEVRGREARQALVVIQPKINEALSKVKVIRQRAQDALASLFGRRFNILGANVS